MTLPEALARLAAAGRIASPWRAGMLGARPAHDPPEVVVVVQSGPNGPVSWLAIPLDDSGDWDLCTARDDGWPPDVEPALSQPATVGCLLALLREASGDPRAYVSGNTGDSCTDPNLPAPWRVHRESLFPNEWRSPPAPTEGEAIAAALIALAEALPSEARNR